MALCVIATLAWRAGDHADAARLPDGEGLSAAKRLLVHHLLWRVTGAREDLEAAHAWLVDLLERADPDDRVRMLANVPLLSSVQGAVHAG